MRKRQAVVTAIAAITMAGAAGIGTAASQLDPALTPLAIEVRPFQDEH